MLLNRSLNGSIAKFKASKQHFGYSQAIKVKFAALHLPINNLPVDMPMVYSLDKVLV